jgi:outer membrane protein assembly factor BamB
MVFVGGQDHKLRALDAHTGKQKWEFDAGGWVETIPATWQGVLIGTSWNLQTDEARVFALDILTGSTVWELRPGWGETCSPAVLDGMAFIGASNNNLYALDLRTGRIVWEFETQGRISGSPTVSDGLVFVGSMDTHVYALEPETGRIVWRFDAEDIVSPPAVWEDLVIVGSHGFQALDAKTGRPVWKSEADMLTVGAPTIWRDQVFVVGSGPPIPKPADMDVPDEAWRSLGLVSCRLYALDARTGNQIWGSPHTTDGDMSSASVWEEGKSDWPMFRGNPQHTGIGVPVTGRGN